MDTSQEYVKMCREAKEIQVGWQSRTGDFIYDYRAKAPGIGVYCSELQEYEVNYGYRYDTEFVFWLPRQDQLQEMLEPYKNHESPLQFINQFNDFVEPFLIQQEGSWKNATWDFSIEQIWLAFVMKEKFNKAWNNETWEEVKP